MAQGLRLLQTGPQPDDNKDKDKDMQLGLQQLHVQALILLGKAHGLAPIESESDAAAHCFLLAARGPCAPLRPLALGNLRLAFARVAALSGGGGAHRLASLHWDGERHAALVAAAVGGFRSWEKQQVRGMSATKRRRPVVLVAGPMAAMLALLLGRALQGRGKEAEPEAEPEAEAGVLVVEDSRVAKTLGKVALEASGLAVGKPGCPVLGFVESRVLLQRLCAGAGAGAKAQGALVEEGKGMEDGEEGKALQGQGVATEEDEVVYAGLLFDPFPYTLPTLPLKILVR